MKTNVFRKFVLTALCSLGLSAWAQEVHHTYEVPAMDAEVQVKAEEVVNKSMEDPRSPTKCLSSCFACFHIFCFSFDLIV